MIKIRINALTSNTSEIESQEGENLLQLVKRSLVENKLDPENEELVNHYTVFINGNEIPKDMWEFCSYKESDSVLVAAMLRGGSFGQIFKVIAIIAITIAASIAFGPGGGLSTGGAFSAALATAAVSIGSTLILNSLIPPPTPGGFGGFGSGGNSYSDSQMNSIAGQSNSVNKFGTVPKVYGSFRMFPIVAANPYTELETDPSTGQLVQFFYAIYDFGYGPAVISELKIGDTPIGEYSDVTFNLVDFNRPLVSEGVWDDSLKPSLTLYKGDVNIDSTAIGINKNQDGGGALEDYQTIRNAAPNPNSYSQEITLNFVCPQGLYGFGTNGDRSSRTIELEVSFSKVGEDNWRSFNDPIYVDDFSAAGGTDEVFITTTLTPPELLAGPTYSVMVLELITFSYVGTDNSGFYYLGFAIASYNRFYKAGTNKVIVKNGETEINSSIYGDGKLLGIVTGFTPISGHPDFSEATLDRPLVSDYWLGGLETKEPLGGGTVVYTSTSGTPLVSKRFTAGRALITAESQTQIFATFKFKPKELAQYKIRVTRITSYSNSTFQIGDALTLYELNTRFDTDPIITENRHVFMELKIRATNQLNGSIQNLSGVVSSVLDVYDPDTETWNKEISSNPAWVFADLLTGEANKRRIDKSRLDVNSLVEWAEFSDEIPPTTPLIPYFAPRFETNFILDFNTTLQGILNSVANAAQAGLNMVDGKYGVLVDKLRTVPIQVFTPRNSSNFSSTRNYSIPADAVRVKFIDRGSNWQQTERIVYMDGYDENTALTFDDLESFACTNFEQAWRFGRYMIAQNSLRQEQISITVDFEYLACTRGDYVQITQDVMSVGGQPARVKTVSGNRITVDDGIVTTMGPSYGYVARSVTGIVTNTLTVVDSTTFDLDGIVPLVGDLIIIGEVGSIVLDCLVKSIHPTGDLSAQLQLVEKADAVYSAESGMDLPPYVSGISTSLIDGGTAPGEVQNLEVLDNTWVFTGAGYEYYVDLDWNVPIAGGAYEAFEIYVDSGSGYDLYTVTRNSDGRVIIDPSKLGIEHDFKILGVSANGDKLNLGSVGFVSATPLRKTDRPSDVEDLFINITNEVIQLSWTAISDIDVKEYLIRYSPVSTGTWVTSIPLLRTGNVNTLTTTQARTGVYLIKALDWNGNESENTAQAITSIPNLFNLNVIETITDFPALTGNVDKVVVDSGVLTLQNKEVGGISTNEFYSVGYYGYSALLDLGEVFTVRLQSLIQAEGYTLDDLMANWVTLNDVEFLSNSGFSDWNVESQVRGTNSFNAMGDWVTLSGIDPLSEGQQDLWTPWRSFIMGDFTGRIFEFRLKLISNVASVSPRIYDGTIKADMPDRVEVLNNLSSSAVIPYVVAYSTPFKGPGMTPNVQITQDNVSAGDRYTISNKTLSSFEIVFYDISNTQVVRQFDAAAKGFGSRSADSI